MPNRNVCIEFPDFDGNLEPIAVPANDWVGLLADPEGYTQLKLLQAGEFRVVSIKKEDAA